MEDREESVQHFLDLIKRSRRGKFKIYIGMIAGVGKSYRMLQEAHEMLENGVDVQIGYIETHGRAGTVAMLEGLPVISRKKIFYKGKEVEEMDLDAILQLHPELVIVDELAHTNIEGSRNEKRWQDVMELLDAGINVISAVNIQHIESLNEDVKGIAGIEVKERIPDKVLQDADADALEAELKEMDTEQELLFLRDKSETPETYCHLKIYHKNATKKYMLERLMEEIPQKKCVAFGSNRNDLSMLTSAQLSYATADAEAEAKAAAKRQLKGHGGDSIVRKIFRLYERLPWEKLPKELREPKE